MKAGRRAWARTVAVAVAAVVMVAVSLALSADRAAAHRPNEGTHARQVPVVAPRVVDVDSCDGVLLVTFDAAVLEGVQWQPALDDGHAVLELHEASGRSGPGGQWGLPPPELGPVTSGGEHRLRWAGWAAAGSYGLHYDLARVVVGGFRSVPAWIESGCEA